MFGIPFTNSGLRKIVISFGQIFNNIIIERRDSNDAVTGRIKVPLAYAPKEKFLVRLDQKSNLENREFSMVLPRLGFEITGLNYDATRKLTRVQKFKKVKPSTEGERHFYNYTPVPYNINLNLHCFTATAEDGLQIIEQILPYFQPDYTVTINSIPSMNIKRDVPIVLNNITYEDSYTGDFTTRRAVIYTLNFTAKTYLYGPLNTQGVIKTVQSDIYTDTNTTTAKKEERIVVVPNPTTADADDDFGFTTIVTSYNDGKKYNPATGEDE
jgi:hypothetical protein